MFIAVSVQDGIIASVSKHKTEEEAIKYMREQCDLDLNFDPAGDDARVFQEIDDEEPGLEEVWSYPGEEEAA